MYNVQSYIFNSLGSILNQTFKNFEIIIVNDNSTDESMKFIKKYDDPRIKIINNKVNCGLSEARNIGLKNVSGDIVYFMDSDDEIRPNLFEKVIKQFEGNNNLNMICFNYEKVVEQKNFDKLEKTRLRLVQKLDSKDALIKLMKSDISTTAWSYMVKKDFLNDVKLTFTPNRLFEDMNTTSFLLSKAKNIELLNLTPAPYLYLQRKDSIMNRNYEKPTSKEINDNFFMIISEYKIFRSELTNEKNVIDHWLFDMLLYYYEFYYKRNRDTELLKKYYQTLKKLKNTKIKMNLREKIKLIMVEMPILFLLRGRG